jgi:parvulin-like peptidyl-prolyl isomerase
MKRVFTGLMVVLFATISVFAMPEVVDKTLAVVNNEPILESEFYALYLPIFEQYKNNVPITNQTPQEEKDLKDTILNQKIEDVLLRQETKKQKIQVSKKEIQDAINEIKKTFANESEFVVELKKENTTIVDFEKKLSEQIAIMKLVRQFIEPKIKIPTEIEAKSIYDKVVMKMKGEKMNLYHKDDLLVENLANAIKKMSEEHVRLRQIFVKCPKNATVTEVKAAKEKVAIIKKELQKQTFADVAKQYSEDSVSKPRDGDLGIVANGDLVPVINKIAFSMKVGDYTEEPIKTDNGYHFIKIEEKRAKTYITFDNIKNDIIEVLSQNNIRQEYANYVNSLKLKANIKTNKTWQ